MGSYGFLWIPMIFDIEYITSSLRDQIGQIRAVD